MSEQKIKCVVWDLDHTIWDGILIEDDHVQLKENVVAVIKELDRRGVLQSISSKNDYDLAKEKLRILVCGIILFIRKLAGTVNQQQ